MSLRRIVTDTLARAGVSINGDKPWDIQVLRDRFYRRAARGALGLGESYIDRDWDVASLDDLFRRIIAAGLQNSQISKLNRMLLALRAQIFNLQSRKRATAVAEDHYDLDYRMYEQFLGPYNQYTCCFFDGTSWPKVLAGGGGGSGQYCVTISTIVGYCLYGANKLLHFFDVSLP